MSPSHILLYFLTLKVHKTCRNWPAQSALPSALADTTSSTEKRFQALGFEADHKKNTSLLVFLIIIGIKSIYHPELLSYFLPILTFQGPEFFGQKTLLIGRKKSL